MNSLENNIGYNFINKELLKEALTHPSVLKHKRNSHLKSYERLEFLGDSVLGLIVAEMLIKHFQHENEGELARRHANLVNGASVAKIALQLGVEAFIDMSEGERQTGGMENAANLEDAMEAIIGAIYLDGGFESAKTVVSNLWLPLLSAVNAPPKDPKSALQEWAQGRGLPLPIYTVIAEEGPAHLPVFTINVKIDGKGEETAIGKSKKLAELSAAGKLFTSLTNSKIESDLP